MLGVLHGYHLDGSGSNLWTRYMVRSLCQQGHTVHLYCQEDHPEKFDFIAQAYFYPKGGGRKLTLEQPTPYPGKCILHRAELGEVLPVYVNYPSGKKTRAVPMVDLTDEQIEEYLEINTRALTEVVQRNSLRVLHVNHAVLLSVVAQRIHQAVGIPFAVMPHGSALEYAVRKDPRIQRLASGALDEAQTVFFVGPEMERRILDYFEEIGGLKEKMVLLPLGVDSSYFQPLYREKRPDGMRRLLQDLSSYERGKTQAQIQDLRKDLNPDLTPADLKKVLADQVPGRKKAPDQKLETTLKAFDFQQDRLLLFVGALLANKGLPELLAAFPLIHRGNPATRLIIVGHGPLRELAEAWLWAWEQGHVGFWQKMATWGSLLEDFPRPWECVLAFYRSLQETGEWEAYLSHIRINQVWRRVHFAGYLDHGLLRNCYPLADVAIFPSRIPEAGPLVFLEALAAGVLPVGTRLGGMSIWMEQIQRQLPGKTLGWMGLASATEGFVMELVRKIPLALSQPDSLRTELSRLAKARFDWQQVASRWFEILAQLRP